jgi:hypothetical protein
MPLAARGSVFMTQTCRPWCRSSTTSVTSSQLGRLHHHFLHFRTLKGPVSGRRVRRPPFGRHQKSQRSRISLPLNSQLHHPPGRGMSRSMLPPPLRQIRPNGVGETKPRGLAHAIFARRRRRRVIFLLKTVDLRSLASFH